MHYPKLFARKQFRWIALIQFVIIGAAGLWLTSGPRSARGPSWVADGLNAKLASYQQNVRLNLEGGSGWINTSRPIHAEDLRGKVVLLDFWTYCCINCHHVIPDLAFLEEKYKNELVVIGVHTAKFPAEQNTENIRKKVAEYRIKHPVINDANQVLWTRFGVSSWPTLAVFDAKGNLLGEASGEGHRAALDTFIGRLIAKHRAQKEINDTPVQFFPESEKPQNTSLLYPGKVLADGAGDRLFVSDTGHNRIVISDLGGHVQKVVGTGGEGLTDGAFDKAQFNRPQGLCLVGDTLFVADTENHALRAIDLKKEHVDTVAGQGQQSQRRSGGGPGKTTGLSSPWDVIQIPGTRSLAVAMAGTHQLWKFDIDTGTVSVWAGSGLENIVDGPPSTAAFAQASGLATDGQTIFVADSEVSGIRAVSFNKSDVQAVHTVVGVNLFGFGDVDGRGSQVRLQHCLGVAFGDGKLFIADSYNNRVKVCDPKTKAVQAFLGTHDPGAKDDPPQFDEPGGLSVAKSTLYVADTNNHVIRAVDLKTLKVTTLAIDPKMPTPDTPPPTFPNALVINVPAAKVEPGRAVTLDVSLTFAEGFKINPDPGAHMPYLIEAPGKPEALAPEAPTHGARLEPPSDHFTLPIPLAKEASDGESVNLKLSLTAFICREKSGLCTFKSYVWNIPVTFAKGSTSQISLTNSPAATALR